jgi:hypothetical protein
VPSERARPRGAAPLALAACLCLAAAARSSSLEPLNSDGLGDPANTGITAMVSDGSRLYAGTWNAANGAQVRVSTDGAAWSALGNAGFGGPGAVSVDSLAVFGGRLYAGTWNPEAGGGLFRMDTGTSGPWEMVTDIGFGDPATERVSRLCVAGDTLYAGCFNPAKGAALYASATGDPGDWQEINLRETASPSASDITAMISHEEWLYIGTEALRPPLEGGEVLRMHVADGALERCSTPGFGRSANQAVSALAVWNGALCAALWNGSSGLEIWSVPVDLATSPGAWKRVAARGIEARGYVLPTAMVIHGDRLYLSAQGRFTAEGSVMEGTAVLREAVGGAVFEALKPASWQGVRTRDYLRNPVTGATAMTRFGNRVLVGTTALGAPASLFALTP